MYKFIISSLLVIFSLNYSVYAESEKTSNMSQKILGGWIPKSAYDMRKDNPMHFGNYNSLTFKKGGNMLISGSKKAKWEFIDNTTLLIDYETKKIKGNVSFIDGKLILTNDSKKIEYIKITGSMVLEENKLFFSAGEALKNDESFLMKLIQTYGGEVILAFDKSYLKNKEKMLLAIKMSPSVFQYADVSLRRNKKFILEVIKSNPSVFLYVDKKFTKDKEFILEAIKTNVGVLEHVDESMDNTLLEENPSLAKNIRFQRKFHKKDVVAPVLELTSFDNKRINLSSLKGKVVLLQFCSAYATLCYNAVPRIHKLINELKESKTPFIFLAVYVDEPKKKVQEFIEYKKPEYTILMDETSQFLRIWHGFGYPSYFIIDLQGKVRYDFYGGLDNVDESIIVDVVKELAKE